VTFEFNGDKKGGWHYAWASRRETRDVRHCMRVYVFQRFATLAVCIAVVDSKSFTIYSRRRATLVLTQLEQAVQAYHCCFRIYPHSETPCLSPREVPPSPPEVMSCGVPMKRPLFAPLEQDAVKRQCISKDYRSSREILHHEVGVPSPFLHKKFNLLFSTIAIVF
jgi:hypothetical protein